MTGRQAIGEGERRAFYATALVCLRFAEGRKPTGRRFGPDADARWTALGGALGAADRLDILIRDADAQWPGAFAARAVFGLRAVAEDDPFGPDWEPLDPVTAEELWRESASAPVPAGPSALLDAAASAWGIDLSRSGPGDVGPTDRLLLVGPGAVAAAVEAFARDPGLDWADQVLCLATPAAHRHLACLAGVALNLGRPVAPVSAADCPADVPGGREVVISDDAHPADAARAGRAP